MAIIEGWFDGVCEPINPGGHAAWGALVKVDGVAQFEAGGYVGHGKGMSNNVAEYSGALAALRWIFENAPAGIVTLHGDSKLVINQLAGKWKIHGGFYQPYYHEAKTALVGVSAKYEGNVRLCWIPRDRNGECDRLSKDVLRKMNVQFQIQPQEV